MIVSAKGIYINFFMIIPFAALVRSRNGPLDRVYHSLPLKSATRSMVLWARHSQILETYYQKITFVVKFHL